MIRPTTTDDTETLVQLAAGTRVFKPMEIETLREVFNDYFKENRDLGHRAFTMLDGERIVAFSYHAPTPMTENTWHLYWIAVDAGIQARGFGATLLRFVEDDIRQRGGRVLFIETSSLPHYEKTRHFYLKCDYETEATLRDFYAAGDHMVVFRKSLI